MSVFAGGFTLDAAVGVCGSATSALDVIDPIDGLVRRSMLIAEESASTTRYRMLETIRQYGEEYLAGIGDAIETRRAHLEWCTEFVSEIGEQLRGPEDAAGIGRMEDEIANIRAALHFAISTEALDAAQALMSAAPLRALWDNRLGGSMAGLAREVAPILGEPDHPVSAALLSLLALDAALRFAGDEAVELAERACTVARHHDDWLRTGPWLAWLLSSLIAGRDATVIIACREALARAIAEDDHFAVAEWNSEMGIAHWMARDIDQAQRMTEVGLAQAEEIGANNLVMRNAFLRGVSLLVPESDPAIAFRELQRAVRAGERVGGNVLYGGAAWALLLFDRSAMGAVVLARELASNLPTPMFLIDANGMMVFYNDATATILGKTFEEVGEIPSAQFGAGLDLATVDGQPILRRDTPAGVAFFQHRPIHQILQATGFDGRRSTYDAAAHPLFGPDGEMQGVVCVFWEHTSATPQVR